MISIVLLAFIAWSELGLCLAFGVKIVLSDEGELWGKSRIMLALLGCGYAGTAIVFRSCEYFSKTAWMIENVFLVLMCIVLAQARRRMLILFSIFIKQILICLDLASGFLMNHYKPSLYTVEKILSNRIAEIDFLFLLIRMMILLLLFSVETEKKLRDTKRNFSLLILLDVLSFILLVFLQNQFVRGAQSIQIGYGYIALGTGAALGVILGIYELIESGVEHEKFLRMQNEQMEKNFAYLYSEQRKLEQAAHDFKNHVNLLSWYLEQNHYQEALDYCRKLKAPLNIITQRSWSGQKMLDTILNIKYVEAEQQDIRMVMEIEPVNKVPMTDYDTCIIFSNLLDNAIEASLYVAKEQRRIRVSVRFVKHAFVIRIENRIAEKAVKSRGIYKSTKKSGGLHGIGLESVKASVDKYNGTLILEDDQDTFRATVSIFSDVGFI